MRGCYVAIDGFSASPAWDFRQVVGVHAFNLEKWVTQDAWHILKVCCKGNSMLMTLLQDVSSVSGNLGIADSVQGRAACVQKWVPFIQWVPSTPRDLFLLGMDQSPAIHVVQEEICWSLSSYQTSQISRISKRWSYDWLGSRIIVIASQERTINRRKNHGSPDQGHPQANLI